MKEVFRSFQLLKKCLEAFRSFQKDSWKISLEVLKSFNFFFKNVGLTKVDKRHGSQLKKRINRRFI
jgi:hypothetical protein